MDQVWSAAAGMVSVLVLVGLAVRFALLPYLREQVVRPVQETHAQVTVNHHSSDPPTMRDQLDTAIGKVDTLGRMFDGHLEWSQNEVDRLWKAMEEQRERGER